MSTWTRARLERVLRGKYGSTPRGAINLAAAAEDLGVSTSTLYRWLHTASPRSVIHAPADRFDQLEHLTGVEDRLVDREQAQAKRARWALEHIRSFGPQTQWSKEGWLEPHLVQVVQTRPATNVRQVAFQRVGELAAKEARRRPVTVIEEVEVSSRFHAEILIAAVLEKVGPWRFRSSDQTLKVGYTRAWTRKGAPRVGLEELAADLPRPVAQRRRAQARRQAKEERAKAAAAAAESIPEENADE